MQVKINSDERGSLCAFHNTECPFTVKRTFLVYDVPANTERGNHAHFKTNQMLLCLSGKIKITLDDGKSTRILFLNKGEKFFHKALEWATILFVEENSMLLSLCDTEFFEEDYIKNYDVFKLFWVEIWEKCQYEVQIIDLKKQYEKYKKPIDTAIYRVLESGQYIGGQEVQKFEEEYANYLNVNYCVSTSNGTDALVMALQTLNIGVDDDVLLQSNAYIADAMAIDTVHANIILVNTNLNYQIDEIDLVKKITKNTKALLLVHMYGMYCSNMELILDFCEQNGIYLIEDCSHVHGAKYDDKYLGTFGDIGCFSFYPTKILGAMGDAGCCVTNYEKYKTRLQKLKNYGCGEDYGINRRMDSLQAAILREKLKNLDNMNIYRREVASYYIKNLQGVGDISFLLPWNFTPAYYVFVIETEYRNELMAYLRSVNIETLIHYPVPIQKEEHFKYLDGVRNTGQTDRVLSLPMNSEISLSDVKYVCEKVKDFFEEQAELT